MFAKGANSGLMEDNLWISEIPEVVEVLQRGGVLVYPTDTIWGIGCDAMNEAAIRRVYEIKHRALSQPLILLVSSIEMLKEYVPRVHPRVETLLTMHHQPLTIVYPDVRGLPEMLHSDKKTVAIRVIHEPFCQKMIDAFGRPIVSTSANVSGVPWPKGFGEISSEILKEADYVVRHRRDEKETGAPSVIAIYNSKGVLDFIRE